MLQPFSTKCRPTFDTNQPSMFPNLRWPVSIDATGIQPAVLEDLVDGSDYRKCLIGGYVLDGESGRIKRPMIEFGLNYYPGPTRHRIIKMSFSEPWVDYKSQMKRDKITYTPSSHIITCWTCFSYEKKPIVTYTKIEVDDYPLEAFVLNQHYKDLIFNSIKEAEKQLWWSEDLMPLEIIFTNGEAMRVIPKSFRPRQQFMTVRFAESRLEKIRIPTAQIHSIRLIK